MPETIVTSTERVFDFRSLRNAEGSPLKIGLHMYRRRFQVGSKYVGDWVFASRNEDPDHPLVTNAVVVVARVGDKVVIGDEFRVPLWTKKEFEEVAPEGCSACPRELGLSAAGLFEAGDNIFGRAVCELRQETGLFTSRVFPGLTSGLLASSSGAMDETVRIVFVDAYGSLNDNLGEPSENIRSLLLSYDEVMEILWNKTMPISSKAWGLFYGWWLLGKIAFFPDREVDANRNYSLPVIWENVGTEDETYQVVGVDARGKTRH